VLATSKKHSFEDRDRVPPKQAYPICSSRKNVLPEETLSSDTFPGKVITERHYESNSFMANYER